MNRLYQGFLYFRNVIRLDGARVRVISCLSLRKCGLSLRKFLRNKCSAALPVDRHSRTISVESTDGRLLTPLTVVWILRRRISRNLEDIYFYGRMIRRILSKTDRNVGKGKYFICVLALHGYLQCLISPKSLKNCGWKFVCSLTCSMTVTENSHLPEVFVLKNSCTEFHENLIKD